MSLTTTNIPHKGFALITVLVIAALFIVAGGIVYVAINQDTEELVYREGDSSATSTEERGAIEEDVSQKDDKVEAKEEVDEKNEVVKDAEEKESAVKKDETPTVHADDSAATAAGIEETVHGNNTLAFEMYAEVRDDEKNDGKNVFISPYSISVALAMTSEGAREKTAKEMWEVLHLPKEDVVRRSSFASLYNTVNAPGAEYTLNTANALWVQDGFKLLEPFEDVVANYYGGDSTNLDFTVNEAEDARLIINSWVEKRTNEKIKDLFPPNTLSPATRLVLTNTIYFKGVWLNEFKKEDTKKDTFDVDDKTEVEVDMMHQGGMYRYGETETLQILELPYKGEELSMLVLLPTKNDVTELEESLSPARLDEWQAALRRQTVQIALPKFTFTAGYNLVRYFKNLGMQLAFDTRRADFSGMSVLKPDERLSIGVIMHKAFVEVNEEGTEAAAATGVVVVGTTSVPPPPKVFRADHPFIFLIQEKSTGSILFLGKVTDPTKTE